MTVVLTVSGARFEGWTEVAVERSLETLASQFVLSLTGRWPGRDAPRPIRVGERCEVALDGERVIVGHVDAVQVSIGANEHRIRVAGRDRSADLVDCSAELRSWENAPLARIASDIAAPFGLEVTGGADKAFAAFTIEPGETCFEAISRAARVRGLLPLGDGLGGVRLASPERSPATVALEVGRNVLSLSASVDHTGRYSSYRLLGQQGGASDFLSSEAAAHVSAVVEDAAVGRHRPWIQIADQGLDTAEAKVRAEWEMSVRLGRSMRIDATVNGWRERPDGPLWVPGRLVPVTDPYLGLEDRELLLVAVLWSLDARGTLTKLALAPREAFQPAPADPAPAEADDGWIP